MHSDNYDSSLTSEGRYRLLVEAISEYAIYMLDPGGRVANWNAGAQRFKGYRSEEIVGENFERFYTDDDRAAGIPQRNLRIAASEGRFEDEGWRVRKDGTQFWAHVVIDRIMGPNGALLGFAKITRDLTERRETEERLRQSERQLRMLVQSVTDYALYMLDREGHVVSWNTGAERIKGYSAAEIIGQHFSTFYSAEDREAGLPDAALATAAREGRFEKEGWRHRKDGSRFWANVIIDPIRDDSGEVIGFAKITRDISERMQAQKELEAAREALFQAQKIEAVGQLTGGVAHDFNNLLMVILGSLEIVEKRIGKDPAITPFIENAIKGAKRGATLTQRMLAFARRQELKMEGVDVVRLVQGMGDIMERAIGPSTIVETRFPLSLPAAFTDANQLESALLNLAVNARDAMPEGGVITISAAARKLAQVNEQKLPPGEYVVLSVEDQGEGMDAATLSRATEPFFTTKDVGKGTGLGLSMVHGLAEQSGGKLALKSIKGRGTTVEIWLPVAVRETQPTEDAGPESVSPAKPLSVLAVDDDALVLMNTRAMLEDLGHRVFDATSAREALELMERETIDLLITDQAMPKMTGSELIQQVRQRWIGTKIVLATGYAELPAGVSEDILILSKPFSQSDLASAIGSCAPEAIIP